MVLHKEEMFKAVRGADVLQYGGKHCVWVNFCYYVMSDLLRSVRSRPHKKHVSEDILRVIVKTLMTLF